MLTTKHLTINDIDTPGNKATFKNSCKQLTNLLISQHSLMKLDFHNKKAWDDLSAIWRNLAKENKC